MLRCSSHNCLQQEEYGHHKEEPGARPLRGSERDPIGRVEGNDLPLAAVPTKKIPATKGYEHQPNSTEQSDE